MRFLALDDTLTSCPYLPGRNFKAENYLAAGVTARNLDMLLSSGFRHFGDYYFRPVCENCCRCVPIRVDLGRYTPSRSERRVIRKNTDLRITVGAPDPQKTLYSLYRGHQGKFEHRSSGSYRQFARSFCSPTAGNTQLSAYLGDRLLAVMHLDLAGSSLSAVYCYYDTGVPGRSLGTYSIVMSLLYAGKTRLKWAYLGYSVKGNQHMEYKNRFRPNQVLTNTGWVAYSGPDGVLCNQNEYEAGFPGAEYRNREPFSRVFDF